MITLSDGTATITLHHLLWTNRGQQPGAKGQERVTLGNRLAVDRLAGTAGREIVLEARLDGNLLKGWFEWSQLPQLEAWRDAGTTLILDYDGEVRAGIIPLAGVDISPVFLRSNEPDSGTKCAGTLIIIEV